MDPFLFQIYRILVPKPVRTRILKKNLRRDILGYLSGLPDNELNAEQKEVLEYLQSNPVTVFPYPFSSDYRSEAVEVMRDPEKKMYYVIQDGKRLYFRRGWTRKRIQRAFCDLSREQDPLSPHRYLSPDFIIDKNDVVADIGAAEGNFSLSVIEKVKKICLIEYDPRWIKALEATFAPWKDKVEIINKYIAGYDDERHITVDSLIKIRNDITFLKIDVDGNEQKVLDGATSLLSGNRGMRIAICTYHKGNDEKEITELLERNRFTVKPSHGYMIHYYDKKLAVPYLRRGLIRAERDF